MLYELGIWMIWKSPPTVTRFETHIDQKVSDYVLTKGYFNGDTYELGKDP